jgi:acyl-CoA synthetase (NDP forming)
MSAVTLAAPARSDAKSSIERLLRPRSVAIVGASDKPGALGASVLANLERNGFAGPIHLTNPKREEIGGRRCLAGIDALPDGVDAAILAIPRAGVLDAIERLAARGVGSAVIFSAGFAEGGEQGLAEQRQIAAIAKASGMIVEGPNCLGLINHADGAALTFVETTVTPPAAGLRGVGIVSQSGAMAAVLGTTLASRALGQTFSISTGNEAASGVEDFVEYLVADADTAVLAMIVEQFRQPARFLAAARAARAAGKTIVLLHPGKSSAARESAATHTGAMAGDYAVMRLLVEQAGVIVAETLEELGDIAEIALRCPSLPSGGTAVMGESGAFKALVLDLAEDLALSLPALTDDNAPALRAALPEFVGVSNPLDLTAQGLVDPDLYARTLTALLQDPRIGTVVLGVIQTDHATIGIKVPPILGALRARSDAKPVIFAGLDDGAPVETGVIDQLRRLGVPYFPSSERALRAVARLAHAADRVLDGEAPRGGPRLDLPTDGGVIPEYAAKVLLRLAGVRFPRAVLATSAAAARVAADTLGYPVVLKAQSAALSHKSDAGGVILNLKNGDAVEQAWSRMGESVEAYLPGVVLDGVLVEAMGAPGVELIVGARADADWGPVILVGFGGVQAEILKDVRLISPAMPRAAILAQVEQLRAAPLFKGWRGAPPLDVDALVDLIEQIGRVMQANPRIWEIDLNPVLLYPRGQGAVALDALMLVQPA